MPEVCQPAVGGRPERGRTSCAVRFKCDFVASLDYSHRLERNCSCGTKSYERQRSINGSLQPPYQVISTRGDFASALYARACDASDVDLSLKRNKKSHRVFHAQVCTAARLGNNSNARLPGTDWQLVASTCTARARAGGSIAALHICDKQ